jgi:hypothetical protein
LNNQAKRAGLLARLWPVRTAEIFKFSLSKRPRRYRDELSMIGATIAGFSNGLFLNGPNIRSFPSAS